jgi:YggT family protein
MSTTTALVTQTIASFINIYLLLLVIRCLLTWFQNVEFFNQVASVISPVTDPYLNLFRSIIPPIGGVMDISPVLAILVLQIAGQLVEQLIHGSVNTGF